MRKKIKWIYVFICLTAMSAWPRLILADTSASENLKKVGSGTAGGQAPYQEIALGANDLASIVGIVIEAFLGLLGVLFLVYMLYAGYNWLIAGGEEEKVTKAKDTIRRAIIGLIIVIAAYAISFWVFDKLLTGTGIFT